MGIKIRGSYILKSKMSIFYWDFIHCGQCKFLPWLAASIRLAYSLFPISILSDVVLLFFVSKINNDNGYFAVRNRNVKNEMKKMILKILSKEVFTRIKQFGIC